MLILQLLQINPIAALAFILGLVFAITIHEFAHALIAYRLGDPTAKLAGRLTLNPAAHLDPVGTFALLLVGVGWDKPTPFDPFNLRNIKRDSALISVAGAGSNFLLAILLSLPYLLLQITKTHYPATSQIYTFLVPIIEINILLGVFNLIPVHPLDGFKVLAGLLPRDWYRDFVATERYGIFILLFLIFTGAIGKILFPVVSVILAYLLPGLSSPF